MVTSSQTANLFPQQYLKQEEESQFKHEYINGILYASCDDCPQHGC